MSACRRCTGLIHHLWHLGDPRELRSVVHGPIPIPESAQARPRRKRRAFGRARRHPLRRGPAGRGGGVHPPMGARRSARSVRRSRARPERAPDRPRGPARPHRRSRRSAWVAGLADRPSRRRPGRSVGDRSGDAGRGARRGGDRPRHPARVDTDEPDAAARLRAHGAAKHPRGSRRRAFPRRRGRAPAPPRQRPEHAAARSRRRHRARRPARRGRLPGGAGRQRRPFGPHGEVLAMIRLVKLALARPYTIVVMALLILIFGVSASVRTPVDIFPSINVPVVSAVFSYSGLSPDDMSGRIVTYYERALTTSVNDIEHIESQSLPNYGVVKIFFQPTVNINAALAQVTAVSQTVLKQMPAGITPPTILSYDASSVPILQLALSSKTLSETTLFDQASSFIRPQLASVAGAAIPLPYGGKVRQVEADLNPQALAQFGLSANDVVTALSLQNLIIPVGTQKIGKLEYTVSLNDSPTAIGAFNDLPIKTANGAVIYMRDVAFVHDGSPPQTNVVHVDGHSAVLLSIIKSGATSTLSIIAGVKALLPQIEKTLPPGLQLTTAGDQSSFVTAAVSGVVREGVIAASLTGLMILLFLGSWRSTLIITVSIPLAILASVAALSALGQTINVMTLGGLALAVGILVDDATVNIENINRRLEGGDDIRAAIVGSAEQIIPPATVSLASMSLAFLPMLGLGGVAGYLFRPLAEAVVFALVASYLLSITLVPAMANALLGGAAAGPETAGPASGRLSRLLATLGRFQRRFEARFEALREGYAGLLALALRQQRRVIVGFFGVSLASLAL